MNELNNISLTNGGLFVSNEITFPFLPQDQDSYGGGFQSGQAFAGELADLFWLRTALTSDQVVALYTGSLSPDSFSAAEVIFSWQDILSATSYGAVTQQFNEKGIMGHNRHLFDFDM